LCYLWSSDFRTHITEKRWQAFCARLRAAEDEYGSAAPPAICVPQTGRRGLAIASLAFGGAAPVLGGLSHGHFDDIALQADWYTGDCVFEAPGEFKVTDLEWCRAQRWQEDGGDICLHADIETPKGIIAKTLRFHADAPQVDFDLTFHWPDWGRGALRLGHFTLLPDAFDWQRLCLTTHNGGKDRERFALAGRIADHGAPVSFLVSASYGFGMTEGWAELGDGKTQLRVAVDRGTAPLLGLLHHRQVGGSLFCQLMLSALELDETRKPDAYQATPRRVRFSVSQGMA
jgi:hypothetical protein